MNFIELKNLIKKESKKNDDNSFEHSGDLIQKKVFSLKRNKLILLIKEIGTIPEDIDHDSSEEKLYSKATDILLAKSLQELGIQATVNKERANCADVVGKSSIHGYSLVGDAKAFRLSRTAKNQKDFKVKSMVDWKGDHDYSVLVCPYFQYPKSNSQIYGQALDGNVCLLSWEHISLSL
ncbi:MAG: HindIII family type II restriction endonuclease [Leptospiraceae bacterium]|nr:HindIII family type II restriction endonuclease [Leptospiraceae bacterium]MCK6381631.1 HindIII family type II restriction endonuclease [Leptospiraceae bacterium]NUM40810.1 HindIII family type II restriction endonuclease [Leptospiraceae bacterium]